jgi:hypothetical protein
MSDQSFLLRAKGAGQPREIQYMQITGVHKDKLSTGHKVTIGVVILGAAIGITAAIISHELQHSFKGL